MRSMYINLSRGTSFECYILICFNPSFCYTMHYSTLYIKLLTKCQELLTSLNSWLNVPIRLNLLIDYLFCSFLLYSILIFPDQICPLYICLLPCSLLVLITLFLSFYPFALVCLNVRQNKREIKKECEWDKTQMMKFKTSWVTNDE